MSPTSAQGAAPQMSHTLPSLPYAFDALEPYIDAKTMEIHHDKHHGGYVNNLNKALEGNADLQKLTVEELIAQLNKVPENIRTAVRMFEHLARNVFPEFRVALLHGRLPSEEKEGVMQLFKRGEIQILVSTTVIEVGVDVPNATVMLIEHADGFGLSQLHQLRGRIGRGSAKSYCLLMAGDSTNEVADERLRTMCETTDGFRIAEIDLKLRGPGEFFGTRQSGIPTFRIANLLRDQEILEWAKREAAEFVEHPASRDEFENYVAFLRKDWPRRYGLAGVA